jgi:hypothetical protein
MGVLSIPLHGRAEVIRVKVTAGVFLSTKTPMKYRSGRVGETCT